MKRIHTIGFILLFSLMSCNNDSYEIFKETPTMRLEESKENFKKVLTSQTNGWEMIYFPDTKEIFSSITRNIKKSDVSGFITIDKNYGTGGYHFWVNFSEDGKVEMLADMSFNSSRKEMESVYTITQNTYLQLNFVSPNYIFEAGQTSFLFYKQEEDGSLILTTNKYGNKSREYIVMRPFEGDRAEAVSKMEKIFSTKLGYERKMQSGQVKLKITDEFQDVIFESNIFANRYKKYTDTEKRYTVFVRNMEPHKVGGQISDYYTALGSGYVPMDNKIKFLPGFRVNDTICFIDFEREGNKYISEMKGFTAIIE